MFEEISAKIQSFPLKKLKPNPDNPRFIKDVDFSKLLDSLRAFPKMLEFRPVIAREDGTVIAGNMRYRAAKELKFERIPVIFVEDLTAEEQKELVIKDNLAFGDWDWDKLANEWDVDTLKDWGLDNPDWMRDRENLEDETRAIDRSKIDSDMQTYINNSIKQVVLYYQAEDYEKILYQMDSVCKEFGIDDNSELVVKLLEFYDAHK